MHELMQGFDWSKSKLGAVSGWPSSLVNSISLLLQCEIPMYLLWGENFIQFYNDAYRPILGKGDKHPRALGSQAFDTWPEIWSVAHPLWDLVLKTGKNSFQENVRLLLFRNGYEEEAFFTCYYSAIRDDEGKIGGVLISCMETTTKIQAEKDQAKMLLELEKEKKIREQFVTLMTHDLRNPLTAAKISAQAIERSHMPTEKLMRFLGRIVSNLNRADSMIENMLDANRIKAGEKLNLKLEVVDLVMLLSETILDLSTVHGHRFQLMKSHPKIEAYLSHDGLRRVIENLCNNAVKFGHAETPITVALKKEEENIILSVHNLGIPIPEEAQKKLFEPHQRLIVDDYTPGGWGLGLTLVKGIVEELGGNIVLESNKNAGTTFTITLPN